MGFSKSPSAFRMSTDGGPRLILSQKHLDAMSDDDHFDVAEAVKRDYLLDLFGFETAFHGTLHSEIVAPAVTAMTKKLVPLVPLMSKEAALGLEKEWTENSEYHDIPLQPTLGGVVARLASLAFVGPELCRNPTWLEITVSYTINRVIAVYILRIFPSFLQPIVHWVLPPCRKLRAQIQQARELILPALEHERQQQSIGKAKRDPSRPFSSLAWNDEYAAGRLYDPTVAQLRMIFVSIHTTIDMAVKVLIRLCEHPELIQPLREEIVAVCGENGLTHSSLERLLLMDSLMKETQRLEPASLATIARYTHRKTNLSDGTLVPKGTQVVLPNNFMWNNESIYPNNNIFDPYRFLRMRDDPEKAKLASFTRSSHIHTAFGHGKHTCPGRFFASDTIKIILCHILLKYDLQLCDGEAPAKKCYGFAMYRDPDARIKVRRRGMEGVSEGILAGFVV
ncbi:uncharacterized protein BHQ10_003781 [Talaromyces amestolkiae]|uniref:Cytochrome P450 n=1 Tax=Talaromyces amestolkiae TaxID=1196081 RepID=A0A364KW67_TALAM|nr:uncharacterized protein BHQ10_003781 [Talaromyces amestolkiae]RAO67769.1 hypothetical protein BHQ10_003781 [Talaromyces amestolkiae]